MNKGKMRSSTLLEKHLFVSGWIIVVKTNDEETFLLRPSSMFRHKISINKSNIVDVKRPQSWILNRGELKRAIKLFDKLPDSWWLVPPDSRDPETVFVKSSLRILKINSHVGYTMDLKEGAKEFNVKIKPKVKGKQK